MIVVQIQRLYTGAALLSVGMILIWSNMMYSGPGQLIANNSTNLDLSPMTTDSGVQTSQAGNFSYIISTTPASNEESITVTTTSLKLKKVNEMVEICKKHKYTVDSLRPRFLNCTNLFKGSRIEQSKVKYSHRKRKRVVPSDDKFYHQVTSCEWIHQQLDTGYYVSEEEKQFPLAFALNVYQSPYQIFRFLKVIYRPHNLYCLHYDKKSDESFKQLLITLSACLPNVIVPKKIEDVIWGWHTIVDAQMNCFNDLYELRHKYPWKYVITLCGKEVPLRTNREMVDTLRKLNETSAVDLENNKDFEYDYWKYKHHLVNNVIRQSALKLGPIPFNLTISKSMAYFGLSRKFVAFLLHDKRAQIFRDFMDHTKITDEHFIATLYNTRGVPGGRNGKYDHLIPTTSSYMWLLEPYQMEQCKGINVHNICIVTSGDLHKLDHSYDPDKDHQTFFHNKFFIERDRVVMDCAEEELLRRNRQECLTDLKYLTI